MTEAEGLPAQDELDVDKLLEEANAPRPERPMDEPQAPPEAAPEAAEDKPEANQWWSSVEFDWNGKKIKPDSEDKARTWMQQGYNYSQRVGELNKKQSEWDRERIDLLGYKEKFSKYSQVDEFAAKNPDWWKHVETAYKARELPQGVDPSIQQVLNPIQEKMSRFEQYLESIEQQKQEAEYRKADESLAQEIQSIRDLHPNIDLSAKDPVSGEPLERKVLKHAMDIGTTSFRVAFRDLFHDQLVTTAKASGLEASAKDAQLKAKKGLLGTSSTPVREIKAGNTRAPWNDSSYKGENILREMGFTK
tara:strand:- start:4067 stop:4981 length:915 start_codon:yes stop_codon:yes gene_type:complete